jgi:hypothetical protein
MKHMLTAFFAGAALMACAPADTTPEAPTPGPAAEAPVAPDPVEPPADACGAAQYVGLIGKPITEPGVPAESPDVRYLRPDTQMTMDYRADRLNVDIDAEGLITGFRCT